MPVSPTEDPRSPRDHFARRLRARTSDVHRTAEHAGYVDALFRGALPRAAFGRMVAQLAYVYTVIDEAADAMRDDPVGGAFAFDSLRRGDAFQRDLDVLLTPEQRLATAPLPSTQAYVERLRSVCFSWPGGFVAHHYTRFLGDLSGGQMMRAAVVRAYGLADGRGVECLTFPAIHDAAAFKADYRARLDAVAWDDREQDAVIDEVVVAYTLTADLMSELAAAEVDAPAPA